MLSTRTCLAVSLIFSICAGVTLLAVPRAPAAAPQAATARPSPAGELPPPTETVITEKDAAAPVEDDEDVVSGEKIAWRTRVGEKWGVMLNGERQGAVYDEVKWLYFMPGNHLVFAARADKAWMLVIDGKETDRYEEVAYPTWSLLGERLAYAVKRDKKWFVVDRHELSKTPYDKVEDLRLTLDGSHLAYFARQKGGWSAVLDGEEQALRFDRLDGGTFSFDGQRFGYAGLRKGKWQVVVDGKEGAPFEAITGFRFSGDGKRFAYVGIRKIKINPFTLNKAVGCAVVDHEPGPDFEGVVEGAPVFRWSGAVSSQTFGVSLPEFSKDGTHVAHAARRGKDDSVVLLDGKPGPPFKSILGGPIFIGDSAEVAYVASDAGATTLVVRGERVGKGSADGADYVHSMVLAPDGRRVAFVAVNGGLFFASGFSGRARRRAYLQGEPGKEYNAVWLGDLEFTEDGQHLLYVVRRLEEAGRQVSFAVIDGIEGKRYDAVLAPRVEEGNPPGLAFVARSGRKFLKVVQPFPILP